MLFSKTTQIYCYKIKRAEVSENINYAAFLGARYAREAPELLTSP